MSQPPNYYARIFDFTEFQTSQPSVPLPGQKMDQELNAVLASLNDTIDRLNEIQRDDGMIRAEALDTTEFNETVDTATAAALAASASATASAATATTKAASATASANTASNAADTATGAAASAQAQATVASGAATTATTKATEASNSAASALASQTSATASAATATTKAGEASGSAANAATSAGNAANSANQAGAQANLSTAAAVMAQNSATSAQTSANAASASASSASASASAAASSAGSFGLNVGTVSSGAPGSTPVVTVAGSSPSYLINFVLPASYPVTSASITSALGYTPGDPALALLKAGNLAGLGNLTTARANLGLGSMATASASDYSTTTVANGLYYPLTGNPSGFLTSAPVTSVAGKTGAVTLSNTDISGLGTMATATATDYLDKAGNLSGLASTSTARSNLGLTSLATAAFATVPQSINRTNTTAVISPNTALYSQLSTQFYSYSTAVMGTGVSGTGANAGSGTFQFRTLVAPNAGVAGYACAAHNFQWNTSNQAVNFSLPIGVAVRLSTISNFATALPAVKLRCKILTGGGTVVTTVGTLAAKGFGWEYDWAAKTLSIISHDGTTYSTSLCTFTGAQYLPYEFAIISDGAGTLTLYINGSQVGTMTGGPTGTGPLSYFFCQYEIENTSTSATTGNAQVAITNPRAIYPGY